MDRSRYDGRTALTGLVGVLVGLALASLLYHEGQTSIDFGDSAPPIVAARAVNPGMASTVRPDGQSAIVAAVHRVDPAVVNIDVLSRRSDDDAAEPGTVRHPALQRGEGSGIIVDGAHGYLVTNHHVVEGASKIRVQLKDGRRFEGQLIGTDALTDVALIRIPGDGLPAAHLGSSNDVPDGSWTIAIGNPLGFRHTVTVGVLSGRGRSLPSPLGMPLEDLLQTDAAINLGNSGGALCDLRGEVIGMNTAMLPQAPGLGFAVPSEVVRYVAKQLLEHGRVVRPWFGASFASVDDLSTATGGFGTEAGVVILSTLPGQPAARARLRPGDRLMAVNGRPIGNADQFRDMVRRHHPGDSVEILGSREGRAMLFRVQLGTMPDSLDQDRTLDPQVRHRSR